MIPLSQQRTMPALGVCHKMGSADPWSNATYFWVVICKNAKAHKSENVMFGHKIPLAETDAFEALQRDLFSSSVMDAVTSTFTSHRKC